MGDIMIFRGLLDLIRLLCIICFSALREAIVLLVHLIGATGFAVLGIAVLWWFGWLPDIARYAASFFG